MYQPLARFISIILCFCISFPLYAKPGDLLGSFPKSVNFFTRDKTSGLIYASTRNDITIIHPETLLLQTIPSMETINGIALSKDGSRLYAASPGDQEILIIDTKHREILESIELPYAPYDLSWSHEGYLYITLDNYNLFGIMQVDLKNKRFTRMYGNDTASYIYGKNFVQISPDHKTLYFGDADTPPGNLAKFRISKNQPEFIYRNPYGALGGGGRDLHLSQDGKDIYYLTTGGNTWFDIARIDTSDMSIKGYLPTGNQPQSLTTSPDGKIAYVYAGNGYIEVWDTEKYKKRCQYPVKNNMIDVIEKMITDNSGKKLFCASRHRLEVYETGC